MGAVFSGVRGTPGFSNRYAMTAKNAVELYSLPFEA